MKILFLLSVLSLCLPSTYAADKLFSIRAYAKSKADRNRLANTGVAIDAVFSDSVMFIGTEKDIERASKTGIRLDVEELPSRVLDFPQG